MISKSKLLEALYIKFQPLTINRINLDTCDNILKCLKLMEQSILQKIYRRNIILLHIIELFKNKLSLPLSITLVIKNNPYFRDKNKNKVKIQLKCSTYLI